MYSSERWKQVSCSTKSNCLFCTESVCHTFLSFSRHGCAEVHVQIMTWSKETANSRTLFQCKKKRKKKEKRKKSDSWLCSFSANWLLSYLAIVCFPLWLCRIILATHSVLLQWLEHGTCCRCLGELSFHPTRSIITSIMWKHLSGDSITKAGAVTSVTCAHTRRTGLIMNSASMNIEQGPWYNKRIS